MDEQVRNDIGEIAQQLKEISGWLREIHAVLQALCDNVREIANV